MKENVITDAKQLAANGDLKIMQSAYQEAGECYEKAAKLLPTGNDETLADYLNWAGYAFHHAALYHRAKPLFEKALAIREKIFDQDHPLVATSINNLAALYYVQGDYDRAKPLFERALPFVKKSLLALQLTLKS